jgi:anti-sigma B factor antagonist
MQYSITERGIHTIVAITGRIDSSNSAEFNTLLMEMVQQGKKKIVLEMGQMDYMSSAGIRVIVAVMKELRDVNGSLKLANLSKNVESVFRLIGLGIFEVYESVDIAVGTS